MALNSRFKPGISTEVYTMTPCLHSSAYRALGGAFCPDCKTIVDWLPHAAIIKNSDTDDPIRAMLQHITSQLVTLTGQEYKEAVRLSHKHGLLITEARACVSAIGIEHADRIYTAGYTTIQAIMKAEDGTLWTALAFSEFMRRRFGYPDEHKVIVMSDRPLAARPKGRPRRR